MKKAGIYSNVGVIPLGVDVDVFKPKTPGYLRLRARLCKKDEKLIISVGRLVEKKGHKYLITAFFHLSKKMNKIKLVIVGDGPLFKQLKDQVHALKIEKKVIFAKEINHKELPKYYSAADLFVLPSVIDGVGNMETQGVVFLEAMASKCPVIGTNTGGIPDVIDNGKTGLLVSPRNDSELEKAMHTILLDEEFRNNLVANAYRKIYSTFLWSKIAKQYVKYYKSVCNNQ
jgi:glycosyltransferase involved in cell wall biosynthesis